MPDTRYWHPFADMHAVRHAEMEIARADDVWVWDADGNRYLDGTASLWCVNAGHNRPEIMEAVRRQMGTLATYQTFGAFSNAPVRELTDRLPRPVLPRGLRLDRVEGAGEVQTPVLGEAAARLAVGDRVWFRHAKAGELCERFSELHLVSAAEIVATVPTYRGEGEAFL